jgi:hypothetical protein
MGLQKTSHNLSIKKIISLQFNLVRISQNLGHGYGIPNYCGQNKKGYN